MLLRMLKTGLSGTRPMALPYPLKTPPLSAPFLWKHQPRNRLTVLLQGWA